MYYVGRGELQKARCNLLGERAEAVGFGKKESTTRADEPKRVWRTMVETSTENGM